MSRSSLFRFQQRTGRTNTEHSAVIHGDGKQMGFWKPSRLVPFRGDLVPPMIECNILKGLFTLFISSCVLQTKERVARCMKTGPGLMLHEDHGEFILMGNQPLKPSSHDFFISHREQEVSQLTGVNAANCAVDKRWDTVKRGGEGRKRQQLALVFWALVCAGCVRAAFVCAPCALLPSIAGEDFTVETV